MSNKILVVDDEKNYRSLISLFLTSDGYEVVEASDGEEALRLFESESPDLIVLDVMLPGISGFDVCKEIRKTSEVPILFLTALDDEDYHIVGYRTGADDYIAKPFKSTVLSLKIKRILKRIQMNAEDNNKPIHNQEQNYNQNRGISIDPEAYTCTVNGTPIALTHKEFLTLQELLSHSGRVLSRSYLLRKVWGYEYEGDTRAVDTLMTKLRKKLGPMSTCIKTVINVGYKFEEDRS